MIDTEDIEGIYKKPGMMLVVIVKNLEVKYSYINDYYTSLLFRSWTKDINYAKKNLLEKNFIKIANYTEENIKKIFLDRKMVKFSKIMNKIQNRHNLKRECKT